MSIQVISLGGGGGGEKMEYAKVHTGCEGGAPQQVLQGKG